MRLFPAPQVGARVVEHCPVCSSGRIEYAFTVADRHVARCIECTMLFLREPANTSPSAPDFGERLRACVMAFNGRVPSSKVPLLVVIPSGYSATIDGCDVYAADHFLSKAAALAPYERAVCVDAVDRVDDPVLLLDALHATIVSGGEVSFTVPSVDRAASHDVGPSWWGFKSGAARFFGVDTLQSLLVQHGFRHPRTYFEGRLNRLSILCRREEPVRRHRLSVIVPVFNELATFDEMMGRLIEKQIEDVDIEIIIVESNSTDGSRERVLTYSDHPRVSVILQDTPKGKGNAVRAGLERATGDIVLFQDADLEYEIEDYDDLIRPIRENRRNFVIGSRHSHGPGSWKIRDFNGAPVLSQVFNVGHLVFLGLLNGLYGQRMADPFSMFKVFRRDCLAGLRFECDRFDFDFEIVIKLLRKGYRPLEIPVNYHARSIAEGKKVTMVRDPLTWLRALSRFRTSELYPEDVRAS